MFIEEGIRMDKTMKFDISAIAQEDLKTVLKDVYKALEDRGYDPVNQLIGYILSADPTYITSHDDARKKIRRFEVDEIVEALLVSYLK